MGVLTKVIRGNTAAASRNFLRVLISGPGGAVGMAQSDSYGRGAGRVRPGEEHRIARGLQRRKKEGKELHEALAVVFARRARGF
jgi:hypothetical protein